MPVSYCCRASFAKDLIGSIEWELSLLVGVQSKCFQHRAPWTVVDGPTAGASQLAYFVALQVHQLSEYGHRSRERSFNPTICPIDCENVAKDGTAGDAVVIGIVRFNIRIAEGARKRGTEGTPGTASADTFPRSNGIGGNVKIVNLLYLQSRLR